MFSISTLARVKAEMDKAAKDLLGRKELLDYWTKQKELAEKNIEKLGSTDNSNDNV